MLACLLSCGLDPKKSIIYKQSDVLEHTQLFWILNTLTPTARLNRFPQWKVVQFKIFHYNKFFFWFLGKKSSTR